MNCKPGDLVRVISHPTTIEMNIVDKIFTVNTLEIVSDIWGTMPVWLYTGLPVACLYGCGGNIDFVPDDLLRPIRGLDGTDESLSWKPVPTKIIESVS